MGRAPRYKLADTAQQLVGGFLLAGPFVVTQEVWDLARHMSVFHALATLAIVAGIGYGALYKADDDRDPDREVEVGGVPLRFLSLLAVSYGSVAILVVVFAAPETFLPHLSGVAEMAVTARAVSVGAIFSVVGAATADSVF